MKIKPLYIIAAVAAVAGLVFWKRDYIFGAATTTAATGTTPVAIGTTPVAAGKTAAEIAAEKALADAKTATEKAAAEQKAKDDAANDKIENPAVPARINGYLWSTVNAASEVDYEKFLQNLTKQGLDATDKRKEGFFKKFLRKYAKDHTPDVNLT